MEPHKKNKVFVIVDGNYALMGFSDLARQRHKDGVKLDLKKLNDYFERLDPDSVILFKFWFDAHDAKKENFSKWKNVVESHGFHFPHFEFKTMNVKATCPQCSHHFIVERSVQAGVDSAITNIIQNRCIDDQRINTLYLFAGDGDFQPMVEKVNNSFKTAHVFSYKDSHKSSLKATAGIFFHLIDDVFDSLTMTTQEVATLTPTPKREDWHCHNCKDFQFARNDACRKCGTKRPLSEPKEKQKSVKIAKITKNEHRGWNCPNCQDYQYARNDVCRMCGTKKPFDDKTLNPV